MRFGKRKLAVVACIAAIGTMVGLAAPAGAGQVVLTGNHNSLAGAGSDTTYWMMQLISNAYNVDATKNTVAATGGDYVTEIPPVNDAPFPAGTFVPGDDVTGSALWDSSSPAATPPNGSSAGVSALDADTTGAIDFVRSSRGPNAGETTTKQFWAYALGAVDYVTFPGTHAPVAGLTQQQLINIYTCFASGPNIGKPLFGNWHQLNSAIPNTAANNIVKYVPQAGSGTRSFFQSKLLNGQTIDANCDASHMSINLEEHDARGVTTASKPDAIYMFDWARWRAQGTGVEANLRNGSVMGKVGVLAANRIAPSATTVNISTINPKTHFLGTRYVFNVDEIANHPATYAAQHSDLLAFIGVRPTASGGLGYICSGAAATMITLAGFVPLGVVATGGIGLPSSHCKLNPNPL